MRAVLDVGQYVSAVINPKGHPAQMLSAWHDGEFDLFASLPILEDLRRVLFYPHIRKRSHMTDDQVRAFVDSLSISCNLTPAAMTIHAVREDPDDDKIVVCAVEANADYIVSSDEHLASLGSYKGIPIIPPRRFLGLLHELGNR